MSERRPPKRPPRKPKGFDDIPELSPEEVERRVDVRGGGVPLPPVERPVRDLRPPARRRRQGGSVARDSLLVLALVVVGIVTVGFFLFEGPATVSSTNPPGGTQIAIASSGVQPSAAGQSLEPEPTRVPVVDPSLDLTPTPTPVAEPATPEPSLPPGSTPRPTPRVTPKPAATPRVTAGPTATHGPTPPGTATLIVKVTVTNDHGGSLTPGSWTVFPNSAGTSSPSSFTGSAAGTSFSISAGKYYQVTAQGPSGYTTTLSNDCDSARGGLPVGGTTETCTIVKNDRQPSLRVYTVVDGGPASPSDWSVTVTGTNVSPGQFSGSSSGVLVGLDANAGFDVAQSNPSGDGYSESTAGACASVSGLAPGAATTCTFTYTYEPPPSPAAAQSRVTALASTGGLPLILLVLPIGPTAALAATTMRRWRTTRTR